MINELKDKTVKNIIEDSLEKSMSYTEYRNLVSELVENESTTGADQTEALVNYTMLNDRRMKRWDKTVKVSDEVVKEVKNHKKDITWLVLTESWCGDAAHVMPVMNKIADLNDNIDFKVVLRDENEDLMNAFLTNGGKSIPKLIAIDNTSGEVLNSYGPRPSIATDLVNDYKTEHGVLTPEFKEDLQRWYNKDKGQTAIQDLLEILMK
jgi:thiol-disulfide isomerase/thioredoxin